MKNGNGTAIKIEATGKLKITEKRKKILGAVSYVIEELFGEPIYAVFINEDKNAPKRAYSINFVFHSEKYTGKD